LVLAFCKTKINLKEYYSDYIKALAIEEIVNETAHGFVIPVSARTDTFVQKNVFLIGDAAGFADPLTAEGISNAILSGRFAAEAILESKLIPENAAQLYHQKLEKTCYQKSEQECSFQKCFTEIQLYEM